MQRGLVNFGAGLRKLSMVLGLAAMMLGLAALLAPQTALAGNSGPRACASMAHRMDVPGLWLGHFSGGRLIHANRQKLVDWRNDYGCFTSAAACHRWRAQMRREWRHVNGHGTCIALRGGGRPYYRHTGRALVTRY